MPRTTRKSTPKAAKEKTPRVPATRQLDLAKALKLRKQGKPVHEIADELGCYRGTASFIMRRHDIQNDAKLANLRISGTPAAVAKKIVAGRNKGLSWVELASRADMEEQEAKRIFENATGSPAPGPAPGKTGGRPVGGGTPAKKTPAKRRVVTKKTPVVKNRKRASRRPS
jgi:hypothetical protein